MTPAERRLVDLSAPLRADIARDPPDMLPRITCLTHQQTAISTQNGTHVDAPYFYFSRLNEALVPGGEVPLDWLYQPAVKLDFRHPPDGHIVAN